MHTDEAAPLVPGRGRLAPLPWVALAGALLALSATAVLVSLWPSYLQLSAPCPEAGICIPPALFAHDVAALARYGVALPAYAALFFGLRLAVSLGYLGLAGVLFWRRRDDPMALCTSAVLAAQPLIPALTALVDLAGPGRALLYAAILAAKVLLIIFFALFPSGVIAPPALRRGLPWLLGVVVVATAAELLRPMHGAVRVGVYAAETLWIVTLLLAQRLRYLRFSSPVERRQTRWLMAPLAAYSAYSLGFIWYIGTVGSPDGRLVLVRALLFVLLYLLELAVILGVLMALRRGLYELDRAVGRTVVYGLLTLCVVILYVLLVGGISLLLRPASNALVALLATGLVAAAFQPLRAALQRGVNQLIYGRRDEPYQVLELLGQRLGGALAPRDMLPGVAAVVRDALRLPYVAVTGDDWEGERVVSVSGEPAPGAEAFPLLVQHERIGRLLAAPRAPDEPFTPHERRLLANLARQISIAAHAARLTDDLQRSRERLVAAREEERRRLQRDLHDELGPTLASMSMQLDAARALLADDPATGEALLAEVQGQLRGAVGTVRQIVHQLRPPILDQLGLLGAIGECALRVERGSGVQVRLDAPAALPPLSAAVEAAAYYLVAEALTNTARHARARSCTVRLRAGRALLVEVTDDGVGLPAQVRAGVGLRSMRERAAEVGGTWEIAGVAGGGTTLRAALPLDETPG